MRLAAEGQPGSAKESLGRWGEQIAARHLADAGFEILARNWRCRGVGGRRDVDGEVDIVARDGADLVLVEVKTRSGAGFGAPAEAVTADKVRRLRRLANAWLALHPTGGWREIRFDVLAIRRHGDAVAVEHVRNAF